MPAPKLQLSEGHPAPSHCPRPATLDAPSSSAKAKGPPKDLMMADNDSLLLLHWCSVCWIWIDLNGCILVRSFSIGVKALKRKTSWLFTSEPVLAARSVALLPTLLRTPPDARKLTEALKQKEQCEKEEHPRNFSNLFSSVSSNFF